MPNMSIHADILEVAKVLREFSQTSSAEDWKSFQPSFPMGADARDYADALRTLPQKPGLDREALRKASFRPFFLVNGLTQASLLARHEDRAFLLSALAAGLVEFADYFEAIHPDRLVPNETPEELNRLESLQRRYFAFCVAQLSECGMDSEGIFMTMKGDSLDMATSFAIREILEEGPDAIAGSSLYTDQEKQLRSAVYANEPGAVKALQQHLTSTYQLPFRNSPTG